MANFPFQLHPCLSAADISSVELWWSQLDSDAKQELLALLPELNSELEVPKSQLDAYARGKFFDEDLEANQKWSQDFYEYYVAHNEILPEPRGFHICSEHPSAQAVIREGIIPHSFTCSAQNPDCPMLKLLTMMKGKSFKITQIIQEEIIDNND